MRLMILVTLLASPALGRPVIDPRGVVNGASYFPQGSVAMDLAQGAMIVIFGAGLGPDQPAQVDRYALSPTLAGVSVQIKPSFGGDTVDALPVYVSARQLDVIGRSRTAPGWRRLVVGSGSSGEAVRRKNRFDAQLVDCPGDCVTKRRRGRRGASFS